MIRDREAYARLRVAEHERELRSMDLEASIAIAESLLTSSLNQGPGPSSRPLNLVRSLAITPGRARFIAHVARR